MEPEHVDVLIVGAGLSGIGAACHLRADSPGKSFAILESRAASGGTWDLFRYPGIRSDSDMFTLGYAFKPWTEAKAIADGPSILRYIRETAAEHDVEERIRYNHRVVRAEWSSQEARWTVTAARTDSDEQVTLTCDFLFGCTGYYRYDEGYSPRFPGSERFTGEVVHPQHWPEDLDYAGKRVVVIGSGATAVTLIPSMADRAAHVTMLQRSPSYVMSLPAKDPIADFLRRLLPAKAAYPIVRWKNVALSSTLFQLSRRAPGFVKKLIRKGVQRQLPEGYAVDTHFAPTYDPWDQRLCLVPDGDLFKAIRSGRASVVTDRIETFTESGIRLASGGELEADVIVTATGLNLLLLGGMSIAVDGREIDLSKTVGYKGMMFSGVPNLAVTIGYTNASWTLKGDLAAEYVCRLVNHMEATGNNVVTPLAPDPSLPTEPFIDLASGYVLRSIDDLPRQGMRAPWRLHQNYALDVVMLKRGALEDDGIRFTRGGEAAARVAAQAAPPDQLVV
ncbi:NAD(P)/FAD-dependent oxidoreductase [Conexibacter stalactiti]|uniref:NAD(P)/FAD-dependent oxidoreductase n=1 Tax=Conexibacter stalactiti TaxID=1940611 RepID=A0ABU4HSK5_9ACTN|nr:NAD(P)/FAD-dependent oxidoreductase [Conexibacter stalactiti]MDW5596220.1 NAD(P)/FAD-dependent oxidoreductase [Conexibacter stalactiti]MEC5036862.1 NAD(P)/FAD-dependent oxidoreductase [Conexibacter stalactiti]